MQKFGNLPIRFLIWHASHCTKGISKLERIQRSVINMIPSLVHSTCERKLNEILLLPLKARKKREERRKGPLDKISICVDEELMNKKRLCNLERTAKLRNRRITYGRQRARGMSEYNTCSFGHRSMDVENGAK